MPYSDKIQKDKSISKRICSYLVREWGVLSHSRLLFTAVVKLPFGWRLSLADFCRVKKLFTQRVVYSIIKIIAGTLKYEREEKYEKLFGY